MKFVKEYLSDLEYLAGLCNSKIYEQYRKFLKTNFTIEQFLDEEYYDKKELEKLEDLRKLIINCKLIKKKYGYGLPKDLNFFLEEVITILTSKTTNVSKHLDPEEDVGENYMLKLLYHIRGEIDSISKKLNQLNKSCGSVNADTAS